jgi:hypothetical protein
MPDYPKTAAYQECFPAPDDPSLAWDLASFEGSVPVPVPHAETDGLHLDGYWISAFDNGGASLQLADPLALTLDWLYDLTESSVTLGIVSYPDPGLNSGNGQLRLELGATGSPTALIDFTLGKIAGTPNQLRAQIDLAGVVAVAFQATLAGENHWRIRMVGQQVFFETSTDPVTTTNPTWTPRGSLSNATYPTRFNATGVELDTNFGAAVVRYYNGCPAVGRARLWEVF